MKVKYISLKNLKRKFKDVVYNVLTNKIEYIVMKNKEPKFKITPIKNRKGKKVFVLEHKIDDKIEKFIT